MSDQRWSWVIRGAVIWYCLLAILLIDARPGFNYDEAIDVRGAVHLRHSHGEFPLPHQPNAWYCLKGHCLPLMSARYIGAVKEYICLPLFAMFGPSAGLARLVATMLGALGIFGVASLVRSQVSAPVAAAVAWAMAIHPSYLAMTVLDNSAFSPWMAAFGLLCIAAAAYLKTPSPRTAFWVGVAVGFGVWARANYTWMIAALCAALVISAWRRLLTLPISHWAWTTVGGLVGGFPFLWYQALSHGGTWEAVGMFPASGSLFQRLQERVGMLAEAVLADGERRRIWGGPDLPSWQLWLFPAMIAVSCIVCIVFKQRRGFLPRTAALTFLAFTGIFFFSGIAVAEHHIVTLIPIAVIVVVLAGWELLHRYSSARLAVLAFAAVYIGSALYWQFATLNGLRRTGGTGPWSDGVFELSKRLQADFPGRDVKVLDWGLQDNLFVISDARVRTRELFWDSMADQTDRHVPWLEETRRGGVFVLNGPKNRHFPAASTGFLRALAQGHPVIRRYTVFQRNGESYAEVVDIVPNTLGAGPELASEPLQEISAVDPRFEEKAMGFYALEGNSWRWTKRDFTLAFQNPRRSATITVHVAIPEVSIQHSGTITMSLRVGEHVLPPETFSRSGEYAVTRRLDPAWMGNGPAQFVFRLDKTMIPSAADQRELGIIFTSASLDAR